MQHIKEKTHVNDLKIKANGNTHKTQLWHKFCPNEIKTDQMILVKNDTRAGCKIEKRLKLMRINHVNNLSLCVKQNIKRRVI